MAPDAPEALPLDADRLHALCEEANALIRKLNGPVRRVSVRAGEYQVDVEWGPMKKSAGSITSGAPAMPVDSADAGATDAGVDDRPAVLALLVGTFYRAPEPGAAAFVEVGDVVEAGQDVAIIEAMKMMNRVQTDRAGRVAEILVEDGEMVEFEQRLIVIEPVEEAEGQDTLFEKILIANRGEIALRVARACRELGVASVAVYSSADASSAVVKFADEAVHIGPPATAKSYLHIPNIIGAALKTGADAIHPGYGFLSEDPDFAEICEESGIAFIGPDPDVMLKMGNKATARDLMTKAGLPLLPGTIEPVTTVDEAEEIANEIGYPLIIKAAAGGGGRGMTVVYEADKLRASYQETRATAQAIFKDSAVYIERFLAESRHTEIQVLCDSHGNGIHLGERDCSVQRRHQKLIEESPSVAVSPELREKMGQAAVAGALSVGYSGVGTMEFLLDNDGNFSFMEMNARIQVEHPVTEAVTGIDLVREQIKVRAGERLALTQDDVKLTGHAIECRINAESPETFAPAPGRLETFVVPGGPWTRVDSHCFPGWVVSPYYDSLIAKLIVWAPDRDEAVERMRRALGEFQISGPGIKTTIPFHERVFAHPVFRGGHFTTSFLEQNDLTSPITKSEA